MSLSYDEPLILSNHLDHYLLNASFKHPNYQSVSRLYSLSWNCSGSFLGLSLEVSSGLFPLLLLLVLARLLTLLALLALSSSQLRQRLGTDLDMVEDNVLSFSLPFLDLLK